MLLRRWSCLCYMSMFPRPSSPSSSKIWRICKLVIAHSTREWKWVTWMYICKILAPCCPQLWIRKVGWSIVTQIVCVCVLWRILLLNFTRTRCIAHAMLDRNSISIFLPKTGLTWCDFWLVSIVFFSSWCAGLPQYIHKYIYESWLYRAIWLFQINTKTKCNDSARSSARVDSIYISKFHASRRALATRSMHESNAHRRRRRPIWTTAHKKYIYTKRQQRFMQILRLSWANEFFNGWFVAHQTSMAER